MSPYLAVSCLALVNSRQTSGARVLGKIPCLHHCTSSWVSLVIPLEERISHLERELEQAEMRGELATLRALEKLRVEHSHALEREAERMEAWIKDLKESHDREKAQLQGKIQRRVRTINLS